MQSNKTASRYAKSLLDLSLEQGLLEQVFADMKLLSETFKSSKDLTVMLKSPIIRTDKKEEVMKTIFEGKINSLTMEFIAIVIRKNREMLLDVIATAFVAQYRTHKKILTAVITTAFGLDEELRKKVIEVVQSGSNSEVELIEKTDKSLIGGFVLSVGDKQEDTSIRTKIQKLTRMFNENPYIKEF